MIKKDDLLSSYKVSDLNAVATYLLEKSDAKVFLFYGDLGAGKTSLIKTICKQLGISELVNSPTYALVNEYKVEETLIYHMDLYRLKLEEEAFDMGIEEYLYSGRYCFIEWPQIIENIIDVPYHVIQITELEDGTRKIVIK